MTVRFGPYPVAFHGGIDTRSDPKAVKPPFLRDLSDAVYDNPTTLNKRPGSRRLRNEDLDGAALPMARALATRDDELVRFSDSRVHSYNQAVDRWADRGALESVTPTLSTIAFASAVQKNADCASLNGYTVYAWEDSRDSGSVRYAIYDDATGAAIKADALLVASGLCPRVIAIGASINVYYWLSGTLYIKRIQTGNVQGSIGVAAVSLVVDGHATVPVWDIVPKTSGAVIAYRTSGPALALRGVDGTGAPAGTTITVAEDPARGVTVSVSEDDERIFLGWCTTAKARCAMKDLALGSIAAAADLATSADFYAITAAWDAASVCHAFWEERPSGSTANNARVYKKSVSIAGAQSGALDIRHSGIATHAFSEGDNVYLLLVFESTLQSTYFLYRDDLLLLGKVLPAEAEGLKGKRYLSRPWVVERTAQVMLPFKRELDTASFLFSQVTTGTTPPAQYADLGLKRLDLDFGDTASHRVAQVGQALYVSGLQLWQYDGGPCPVESGFHLYPEGVTNPSTAAGAIPIGSYAYRVYEGWVNDKGEAEISSTSQTILVAVAAATKKVTIRIPTLSHTVKTAANGRERVFFIVTRSKIDPFEQSPLYRVSSTDPSATGDNGWVWNSPSADTVDFVDNMLDGVAALYEQDYLSKGELDRLSPPVGAIIAGGKERLFVASGNTVFGSLLFDGRGLAFNENLEIPVDPDGGDITGLEVMDDRLLVFKQDRVLIVIGEGPNNLGQGGWEQPQRIPGDVGCVDQRSIAQSPPGIAFQSSKGIRLLDRRLQIQPIGYNVDGFNDQTVTASAALVNDDLIIFLTDEGRALVYDYSLNNWTTWKRYTALDATLWQGELVRVLADGRTLVKDNDLSQDDGETYGMVVEFPHLQPAGPQGFVQIKRALFLGQYHSPHKLRPSVCYDMEPIYTRLDDFDPADTVNLSTWGSDASWGDGAVWGGEGSGIEHFEASMPRQKCFAYGLKLEEVPSSTPGRAFSLVGLVCEVAGQPGAYRVREAIRVAASAGGGGGGPGGGA